LGIQISLQGEVGSIHAQGIKAYGAVEVQLY